MPQGKGTYGKQVGRPPGKSKGYAMKRGSAPKYKDLGSSTPGDSPLETFSGQAALGGAAKGAAMGSAILPGWGTAIGGVIGGIAGGIKGGKAEEAEAAVMEEEKKNLIVAAKLKEDSEREALGYGETDNETGPFSPTTT